LLGIVFRNCYEISRSDFMIYKLQLLFLLFYYTYQIQFIKLFFNLIYFITYYTVFIQCIQIYSIHCLSIYQQIELLSSWSVVWNIWNWNIHLLFLFRGYCCMCTRVLVYWIFYYRAKLRIIKCVIYVCEDKMCYLFVFTW